MPKTNSNRKVISIKGARLHNLKDISLDIPRNKLTVITGVSGSGKSSLAFDTIYAEGQRRFVESLSSYARQFLERIGKPDVDAIDGLPPAIAIEQRPHSKNPRSTVGTSTEIYDYLRVLYGRIGESYCHKCGELIKRDSPVSVADLLIQNHLNDKAYILFKLPTATKYIKEALDNYRETGIFRAVINGSNDIIDLQNENLPENASIDNLNLLIDRIVINNDDDSRTRLIDSLETAFSIGLGRIAVKNLTKDITLNFSSEFECSSCGIVYCEPEPRLFSFNNPYGACPNCQGFGRTIGIDEELVIPDRSKSIKQGAIHPFRSQSHSKYQRDLLKIADEHGIDVNQPFHSLDDEIQNKVWEGVKGFAGINGFFEKIEKKYYKIQNRVLMSRYRGYTSCRACGGSRLRTSARQVFVAGKSLPEVVKMSLDQSLEFVENIHLNDYQKAIASQVMNELQNRIRLLVDIGLEYLTLDRLTHTLSGGEAQRINLSTALGSSLVGTLYVLDEPSIGLHSRDTQRLLNILFKLRDLGNTVIVVEHDPEIITNADHVIDIGPKAGEFGGELIFEGDVKSLLKSEDSLTGAYLSNKLKIELPEKYSKGSGKKLEIIKPLEHNLKIEKVSLPLGAMVSVTGVSGSGKSTLIFDVLYGGVKKIIGSFQGKLGKYERILGAEYLHHIELVDQSPIGKSSRSTPATFTKVFDPIRELFSRTQAAKQMGWKPGYFSFNVTGGRCEVCEGKGSVTVDMQFMSDIHLECEECKGTRYKREIRNLLYNGKSIVDVLNMTVDEAYTFFTGINKITKKLKLLIDVGLGYLRLGQPSTMLSGGEAQRIKLANHLDTYTSSGTLFIFDEPTTGLHIDDIRKLIDCFRRLVNKGHSVIIIEHNLHVIAASDWVIDLGPGAGNNGGRIIAEGSPKQIARKNTYTGVALSKFFSNLI